MECPISGELFGEAGDLMVFPPGSMITMKNRPLVNDSYRADALSLSNELVSAVFSRQPSLPDPSGVQVLRKHPHQPSVVLDLVKATLESGGSLPDVIYRHRRQEPLVWLREAGVRLTLASEDHPLAKVRRLVETDLAYCWRAPEAASISP